MNFFQSTLHLARTSFSRALLASLLGPGLIFAALVSPSVARAQVVPSGLYSGTMHSYCPSFDYHNPFVLSVFADGTFAVGAPDGGGASVPRGSVAADGTVDGLSLQVNSLSRGHLVIPYTLHLQADGTLAGSGASGDIHVDVAIARERAFTTPAVAMTVVTGTSVSTNGVLYSELSVTEGKTKPTLVVTRYGEDLTLPLKVTYKSTGSAKPGVNYKPLKGSTTIPAGQASTQFKLTTLDNDKHTAARVLQITLAPGANRSYTVGQAARVRINILDRGK